jgi:rhomboid protease GluP
MPRAAGVRTAEIRPAPKPLNAPSVRDETFDAFYAGGIPIVTCGFVVLLTLVFAAEVRFTGSTGFSLSPTRQSLTAMGGIDGNLVFGAHEWWRFFTAPMLHASFSHLFGNCVALLLAGFFLEPLIGAGWFGVLFFVAALGGAAGSLAQNDPGIIGVGASGGISGLLAAGLFFSYREKDLGRRRRMQFLTARTLIPAVAPIFFTESTTGGTDYAAHAGGAMAGIALCLAVSAFWHKDAKHPAYQGEAVLAAAFGAILTIVAFVLTAMHQGIYMAEPVTLIPPNQTPQTTEEGEKRSAELVQKFPTDPRAHYYRALYFYNRQELADAADQLRIGIADLPAHAQDFSPQLGQTLKMTLALIQNEEGDLEAARATAKDSCTAAPPSALLEALQREKICE